MIGYVNRELTYDSMQVDWEVTNYSFVTNLHDLSVNVFTNTNMQEQLLIMVRVKEQIFHLLNTNAKCLVHTCVTVIRTNQHCAYSSPDSAPTP